MDKILKDLVICCLTNDSISNEFTQKSVNYLNRVYLKDSGYKILDVEAAFSSGTFSGGEFDPEFRIDVKDKHVYCYGMPTNISGQNYVSPGELMNRFGAAAQAAYDSGATQVHVVAPNLLFSRADKRQDDYKEGTPAFIKNQGRGRIAFWQAKRLAASDIESIVTLDLHSDEVKKFYEKAFRRDNAIKALDSNPISAHYLTTDSMISDIIKKDDGEEIVIVAPDSGVKDKVNELLDILHNIYGYTNVSALYLDKIRKHPNNPDELLISVDEKEPYSANFTTLKDKIIVILDDMVDTAGTLSAAVNQIMKQGIRCNGNGSEVPEGIVAMLTHPVLAGKNYVAPMKKLASANLKELVLYNTHPFIEDNLLYPLKNHTTIIRTAFTFAEAIVSSELGTDVNGMFYTEGKVDPNKVDRLMNIKRSSSHILNGQ